MVDIRDYKCSTQRLRTPGGCDGSSSDAAASITSGGEHLCGFLEAEGTPTSDELRSVSVVSMGSVMSSCEGSSCGALACTILTSPGMFTSFIPKLAPQAWPFNGHHCPMVPCVRPKTSTKKGSSARSRSLPERPMGRPVRQVNQQAEDVCCINILRFCVSEKCLPNVLRVHLECN